MRKEKIEKAMRPHKTKVRSIANKAFGGRY